MKINFKEIVLKLKELWPIFIVICCAVVFLFGTAKYNLTAQTGDFVKWLSPDETANYVFTKLYAQTDSLSIYEKYNLTVNDIIKPRSFRSDSGNLKPVSFLGIILIYGSLAALTSYKLIPFFTPLFGAIAIIFYYLLIKKIFGKKVALLSTIMLASFPVYIYYSARSMFHNVLFISLLIIGMYFAVKMAEKIKTKEYKYKIISWVYAALAGVFIGLAIITRTSELLWLGPALFLIWIFNIRQIGITKLFLFAGFLSLAMVPALYWNNILYSSPISSGYPEMNQSISAITSSGGQIVKSTVTGQFNIIKNSATNILNSVFHFGLNTDQSLKMAYHYFVKMFPFIFWPAVIGLILFSQRFFRWKKKHLVYVLNYFFISAVLILYYGSWKFFDNPDPSSFTIGNSYTRYWLPVYLMSFPFASLLIIKVTKAFSLPGKPYSPDQALASGQNMRAYLEKFNKYSKQIIPPFFQVLIMSIIVIYSVHFVLSGSEEGLIYSAQKQLAAKAEYEQVIGSTPSQAVIITQYHDKLLFPERKVIVGLFNDDNMNSEYAELAKKLPVYYYNFTFPEKDIKYLNESKLKKIGLSITPVKSVNNFTLYKLDPETNTELSSK